MLRLRILASRLGTLFASQEAHRELNQEIEEHLRALVERFSGWCPVPAQPGLAFELVRSHADGTNVAHMRHGRVGIALQTPAPIHAAGFALPSCRVKHSLYRLADVQGTYPRRISLAVCLLPLHTIHGRNLQDAYL